MIVRAAIVLVVVFGAFAAIVAATHKSPMLKDQFVPQLPASAQTYSLARTQMAFWFLVILASTLYLVLFRGALLSDPIITGQAVTLMGLSLATAGAAAGVDHIRDTPEDSLNDALKAIGLASHQDVIDLEQTIARLSAEAAQPPSPAPSSAEAPADGKPSPAAIAQARLNDARIKLQFYRTRTQDFRSQGFFPDLITNLSGTGLHRLQAVIWTVVVGALFVVELYSGTAKALPVIDNNLLALMGISSAGYVGFKVSETNY